MFGISTLITLLIFVVVIWIAFWIIDNIALPAPASTLVKGIVAIIALIELLHILGLF